jgi:hypothetical protein
MTSTIFDIEMNVRTPYIIHFEDLIERSSYPRGSGFIYSQVPAEPPHMLKARTEVLNKLMENKELLDVIEEKMLNYLQEMAIQSPQVYIARTKDIKTDIEYFTAKTFWEQKGGVKKEIKIYIGKAEDYDNDTRNPKAKKDAILKMAETLRRRKDAGEI